MFLVVALSCAGEQRHTDARHHPWFDATFEQVFEAAVDAVKQRNHRVEASRTDATIKSAWQQIGGARAVRSQDPDAARLFVRFDVSIVGTRPYEVRVVGHASMWRVGSALPTPLEGADEPPWLAGRVDALRAAIYEGLRQYAVETEVRR